MKLVILLLVGLCVLSVPTHSAYTRGKHCLDAAVKDYTKCMLAANSPHANGATDACRGKLSLQMQSCGIATNHHSVTQMQNKAVEMHVGASQASLPANPWGCPAVIKPITVPGIIPVPVSWSDTKNRINKKY